MQPPSLHLPVWPFWLAGAACEAVCAPFGIEPPIYRRRVDFFTKSRALRHRRARQTEIGYAPTVGLREGIRPHARLGIARPDGSDERDAPGRSGRRTQLFRAPRSARARTTSALIVGRPAGARCSTYELVQPARAVGARRARPARCARRCYPSLLGACGRSVVFGQNVVLRHPHKIRIGDDVVIDDNCLLDAKGDAQRAASRSAAASSSGATRILSCKNGDIELGDGANIGFNCEIFSASRVDDRPRHAARGLPLRRSAATTTCSDPSAPVLEQGRRVAGRRDRRGRVARRRRQDPRRRDDRRSRRSSARAPSCARRFPTVPIAVGVPARIVGGARRRLARRGEPEPARR